MLAHASRTLFDERKHINAIFKCALLNAFYQMCSIHTTVNSLVKRNTKP